MENIILSNQSDENSIRLYFEKVIELKKSGNEFPTNLDEVWPLVYSEKSKAVKVLRENFFENSDYQVFAQTGKKSGRPSIEYFISVSCLEYLVARKDRRIFEVYRKVFHQTATNVAILSEAQLLLQALQVATHQNKVIESHEERIKAIEQRQSVEIKQDYFTIIAFCRTHNIQITFSEAIQKGKLASRLSKEHGFEMRNVPDERYGYVHSYREEILKQTFQL